MVIGATGYTGGLIAEALARADTPAVLAARDPDRLGALAERLGMDRTAVVDVTDPASLRRLIRPGDAVINTAGPFTELGEPVVAACVEVGAHYLDTTGEQPFMRTIQERYHEKAEAAGVSVVNAMAFEYALGDCAVAVAAAEADAPVRTLDVVYAWGGTASSQGTRRTILRMMGRKGWVFEDGDFRRQLPAARRRRVMLASGRSLHAVTFGSGEVVTVPRHVDVPTIRGWMTMGGASARMATLLAPALPAVVPIVRPLLEPLVTRKPDPTPAEREASEFTIRVELTLTDGSVQAREVRGRDPYGVTATAAIHGARRAMQPDAPRGVLAPAELVTPSSFLASLAPGVELRADR